MKKVLISALSLLLALTLGGCGVSPEELGAVAAERSELQT